MNKTATQTPYQRLMAQYKQPKTIRPVEIKNTPQNPSRLARNRGSLSEQVSLLLKSEAGTKHLERLGFEIKNREIIALPTNYQSLKVADLTPDPINPEAAIRVLSKPDNSANQ